MESKHHTMDRMEKDLVTIESAIGKVSEYKKQLEDNAKEVKQAIQNAVGKQLVGLHSRQTQLLRQVDALVCHQMSLLQSQYAILHQASGTLKTAIKLSAQPESNQSIIKESILPCALPHIKSPPSLKLIVDDETGGTAVKSFGKIQIDGFLDMADRESSASLPNRVEYYNDEDHMVLYKPLRCASPDSPVHVKVAFPKLPEEKDFWLMNGRHIKQVPSTLKNASQTDVEKWLFHMKDDTVPEPDLLSSEIDSYEVLSHLTDKVSSSYADSIEIISDSEIPPEIPKDAGQEKGYNCTCKEPQRVIEIENLNLIACVNDKDKWLMKGDKRSGRAVYSVGEVCRANETCSSFDDCVCDDNCGDMTTSQASVMSALTNSYDQATRWIIKRPAGEEVSEPSAKRRIYSPPQGRWLQSATSEKSAEPSVRQRPSVFSVCLATIGTADLWLLRPQTSLAATKVNQVTDKFRWLAVGSIETPLSNIKAELERIAEGNSNKWLLR